VHETGEGTITDTRTHAAQQFDSITCGDANNKANIGRQIY